MASVVVSLGPQGSRNSTSASPASFLQSPTPSGYSKTPPHQERHLAQLWEETFCVFLCNKIECVCVCVCRCSVFLQTPLLGCYEIKTIFSLVNASLPNHWSHIIHSPFSTPIFLGTGGNGN